MIIIGDLNKSVGNDELGITGGHDKITRGGEYVRALLETCKYVLLNNKEVCEGGPYTRFDPAHPDDDEKKSSLDLVIISRALLPHATKLLVDSKGQYGAVRASKTRSI